MPDPTHVATAAPSVSADNKNRFLRETMKNLAKLQRIVESQKPGAQEPVQGQFDELVVQLDVVHAAMVERGFLPLDKSVPEKAA